MKKDFGQKKFWTRINFGKKILVKKNLGPKKIWSKKIFGPKKLVEKNVGLKFNPEIFSVQKNVGSQ